MGKQEKIGDGEKQKKEKHDHQLKERKKMRNSMIDLVPFKAFNVSMGKKKNNWAFGTSILVG